jgi:uncharacterized membrane protein HdeD (DUF308 family)
MAGVAYTNRTMPRRDLFAASRIAENWALMMTRGIAGIIFGILAITWPGMTLLAFVTVFGLYVGIDGVVAILAAFLQPWVKHRWWLGLLGAAGIVIAIITLRSPGITALLLLTYMGAWAIVAGLMQVIGGIVMREEIRGEWMLIAGGAVSMLFGGAMLARPGAGALAMVVVIGFFAIVHGALIAGFSLRLRRFSRSRNAAVGPR